MTYQYLLFDLDHTLLDFGAAEDVALTQLLEEERVSDIQAYKAYYIPMNQGLWRQLEQGKISKAELVESRFARLFAHFGLEKDGSYLAERYQHYLSQQGQTYPAAHHLLDSLIDLGYDLYAATNGLAPIQRGRLAASGLASYFTDIFISEELASQKPEKLFYEKIAKKIKQFDPSRALMIGDSLTADIAGGNRAQIDTLWYNPAASSNQSEIKPTYTVQNYDQILDLLTGLQ
ncbi:YjjG family noncanonical pyrimidine nucleotidase [Streptococcus oricebi]|uniref:Noncanonical pyrimidine nucleotidase, YjjG family n=1 Tax=Streptococcus oricebi TaxID=1547447 RepID=A0ABS5B0U8_9STRE|nr:YjjG family noncanonical pyrimidine nucleotidase [Streptococcus oricebi]MBP2622453.1 noncanonical pyrimidine nucleotidase, YjjG family [Streptococcus oricebi]